MTTDAGNWVGLGLAGGRYHVTAKLGEGGMGLVYRARDRHLDAEVVVKVPRSPAGADAGFAHRFAREIRSLVRLAHPHIVKVTDFGTHEECPFAVMQYLAGGSLKDRQRLDAAGEPLPAPPEDLFGWLEDAAAALDYIHEQKYVHRDVKPTNILFDTQGHAYLGDFGLAKVVAEAEPQAAPAVTGAGIILGTAEYMAPELIMGRPCDGRTDQYALAVTVHEMLHGQVPFEGPTPTAILVKHTVQMPPALHELRPALTRSLSLVVAKALSKDPQDRYESCTAFARALVATVKRAPVVAGVGSGSVPPPPIRPAKARVPCPSCHQAFDLPAGSEGKRLRCPACKIVFQAPAKVEIADTQPGMAAAGEIDTTLYSDPAVPPAPGLSPHPAARSAGPRLMLEQKCLWGHEGPVQSVAFSADGRLALSGSADACLRLWDLDTGQERCRFLGHVGAVQSVALSADGYFALSGGADATIRLWNVETGRELHRFVGHAGAVLGVAFAPDSNRILSGGKDDSVRLWDLEAGRQLRRWVGPAGEVPCVAYAPDGRRVLAGYLDGTLLVWDVDSGQELHRLTGHDGGVHGLAIAPSGGQALSGGRDRSVRLWDLQNGREIRSLAGHLSAVTGVAFCGNSGRAVSSSLDNTISVWDLASGTAVGSCLGHMGPVACVAGAADGTRILSGGADQTVRLW